MPEARGAEGAPGLQMQIEAGGMRVAAARPVPEVGPGVCLVRALVLREPRVPIDPEQGTARGTWIGDEMAADL